MSTWTRVQAPPGWLRATCALGPLGEIRHVADDQRNRPGLPGTSVRTATCFGPASVS
jgi:hypothetical protein